MKKIKMLALSLTFAASTTFCATSTADVVGVNDKELWSPVAVDLTNDFMSIVTNHSNSSESPFSIPPAFWLLGTAMVFLFRKPHSS